MRVVPPDVPVLASPGLGFVSINHDVVGTSVGLFRHERPLQACRESGATTAAQTRCLNLFDDGLMPALENCLGAVPGAARTRGFQPPVEEAVEVGEDAILIFKHRRASH